MRGVATNVLVRALVRDGPSYVPVTVVLELEWVLRSHYGFTPRRIAQAVHLLAALPGVTIGERDAVLAAAVGAAQGWDLTDALHHALSAGCDDFVTLDTTLARQAARVDSLTPPVVRL